MNRYLWPLAPLTLILILAAILRIYAIDERSLWEDEGWTLVLIQGEGLGQVVRNIANDQHTPLYFVLVRLWTDATGRSEFSLRMFSALLSLLCVATMYPLGRQVAGRNQDKQTLGLMAALLLALWDFSIDLAQDARQYTLLLWLCSLSCYFYLRYWKKPTSPTGLAWLISSVLALYTQYMAGVVLVIQLLHALLTLRPPARLRGFILRWGLMALAFAPWLPIFWQQNRVRWQDPIYYQSGLPNTAATFVLIRDALLGAHFGLSLGLLILGLGIVFYRPSAHYKLWPDQKAAFWALLLILYIGLLVYLNHNQEILRIRLFILILPPVLLLMARGLQNLPPVGRNFLLVVILGVSLTTRDTWQNHAPWRAVVANAAAFHQADESILMDIWVGDFPARYYVARQMGEETPWLSLRELRTEQGDLFLPALLAYLEGRDSFWLLRWNDEPQEYDGLLAEVGFQRTASPFVLHEGNFLYTHRYDRLAPDRLASFGESITLLKAELRADRVFLWWVPSSPPPVDYSVSVFLLNAAGEQVWQNDSPPLGGLSPSSTWQAEHIYYDQHPVKPSPNLAPGTYQVGVRLYWYVQADQPLAVQALTDGVATGPNYVILGPWEAR